MDQEINSSIEIILREYTEVSHHFTKIIKKLSNFTHIDIIIFMSNNQTPNHDSIKKCVTYV